jgi:hypothetical protein
VPLDLLRSGLRSADIVVWMFLAGRTRKDQLAAWPSRELLMRELGRCEGLGPEDRVHANSITAITRRLVRAGWLSVVRRRHKDRTRNVYTPLGAVHHGDGLRYVPIEIAVMDLVQTGLRPEDLVYYARWMYACGAEGWTSDTLPELALAYGGSACAAKHSRTRLVKQHRLLDVHTRTGLATLTARPNVPFGRFGTGVVDDALVGS